MSVGDEGIEALRAERSALSVTEPPAPKPTADPDPEAAPDSMATPKDQHHDHHVLIDAHEDRWNWRAKIRRDPRKLVFYRIAVGIAGAFMIILGAITGPLPGPGGIPLVLLGIAIWSSEFEWAQKLMLWLKAQLERYRRWPRRRKIIFWIAVAVVGASCGYGYLRLMGIPFWFPGFLKDALGLLPGL